MKARHRSPAAILIGLLLTLVLQGTALATVAYDLSWSAIAGGGTLSTTGGPYALGATIGQAGAGPLSGGGYDLYAGFWQGGIGSPGVSLDIDGNGHYDALTDGLLILRFLFGLTGNPMTAGAIGPGSTRVTPEQITQQLNAIRPILDIDGNGQADALTDGLMLLRYLFGLRGAALTAGAIGTGAPRSGPQIEAFIRALMP